MARGPTEMADATTDVNRPATPIPARFWWLKRFALAGFLIGLTLVGVHLAWDYWAQKAWDRFVAERRAEGEPVLIEDYAPALVPDEENGAQIVMDVAARSSAIEQPNLPTIGDFTDLSAVRAFQSLAHRAIEERADLLCDLRAARDLPRTNWGTVFTSPLINVLMPYLSPARNSAKLACAAALVEHDRGSDAEAVESLIDGLEVGARLRRSEFPCVITDLVAIACDALVASAVQSLVCELLIADGSVGTVSRSGVQRLIDRLIDESELRRANRLSMLGERLWTLDTFQCIESGKLGPGTVGWISAWNARLLWPAWRLDCIGVANRQTNLANALGAANWPAAQAHARIPAERAAELGPVTLCATLFSRIMESSLSNAVALQYRGMASRRMAAIGLAIRMYELDHGRLPNELSELVPRYLRVVPLDPMAADGRQIGYVRTEGLPRLYSVGLDGVDQLGRIEYKDGIPGDSRDEPLFFLTERPSSAHADLYASYKIFEAYENDRQEKGDERNDDQQDGGQQQDGDGPK
jgi:hypothetical protein